MESFYRKHKILIALALFFGFAFFSVHYLGIPMIEDIVSQSDQIQAEILDRQISEKKLKKLPQMKSDWDQIESQKDSLRVILEGDDQVVYMFLEGLEKIAQDTNNQIKIEMEDIPDEKTIKKQKRTNKDDILSGIRYESYIPMKITLTGNYQELINFIHALENDRYYVNIYSISISKDTQDISQNSQESLEANAPRDSVFSLGDKKKNPNNFSDKTTLDKKEVLKSLLEAVVYRKKT